MITGRGAAPGTVGFAQQAESFEEARQRAQQLSQRSEQAFNALTPAPQPVRKVDHVYPPLARQARIQGDIRLRVTIASDGTLSNMEVISGHPLLVPAAMEAVRQWTFPSGSAGEFGLRIPFRLDGGDGPLPAPKALAEVGGVADGVPGGVAGGVPGGVVGGVPGGVGGKSSLPSRIRVGGQVQAARLTNKVDPVYPPLARQAQLEGAVTLQVVIGKEGQVENVEVLSGHPLLAAAAMEAVKQWIYQPTLLNQNPVEVVTQVTIPFALNQ